MLNYEFCIILSDFPIPPGLIEWQGDISVNSVYGELLLDFPSKGLTRQNVSLIQPFVITEKTCLAHILVW